MQYRPDSQYFNINYNKIIPYADAQLRKFELYPSYTLLIGKNYYSVLRYGDDVIEHRLYLVNITRNMVSDYIKINNLSYMTTYGQLIILSGVVNQLADTPNTYVYGINNYGKLKLIAEIYIPSNLTYSTCNNMLIYLEANYKLHVIKYDPELNTVTNMLSEINIPGINPEIDILKLNDDCSNYKGINNVILCHDTFIYDEDEPDSTAKMYVVDISTLPFTYKCTYTSSELIPRCLFWKYDIRHYVDNKFAPVNLNIFSDALTGMTPQDIYDNVAGFQIIKIPGYTNGQLDQSSLGPDHDIPPNSNGTLGPRHSKATSEGLVCDRVATVISYEIVILNKSRKSIHKNDIKPYLGQQNIKIINTYRGVIEIVGDNIFSAVEHEYTKTFKRLKVTPHECINNDMTLFIHPFRKITYSESSRDGIIELSYRTMSKNVIIGYYIFVVLPKLSSHTSSGTSTGTGASAANNPGEYYIKIIGYYPTNNSHEIYRCEKSQDTFIMTKDTHDYCVSYKINCMYSTYIKRVESKLHNINLGLRDHIISNISQFYVCNKYLRDIRSLNNKGNLDVFIRS